MNKELAEAVKLFISQPLNNPLSRGQIMEVARIALPILEQQERGLSIPDGYRLVPEKLTDEMLRRIIPNMAHSLPISHDEYDYYGRNERFVKWVWARLLKLSETAIPEQQERGDDGWIEWGGGKCPVDGNASVEIEFRDGRFGGSIRKAGGYYWGRSKAAYDSDIIAYRIIPEQPTNQNGETS